MRIVVVLLFTIFDVCHLYDREETLIRKRRQDIIVNPIWPTSSPPPIRNNSRVPMFYNSLGYYYVNVDIGNPSKSFKMLLSTSSDYTTVKSTRCKECTGTLYNGDESDSVIGWNETERTFTTLTIGGRYNGIIIKDRVTSGEVNAYKTKILAADSGSKEATTGKHDGVLSLRYETFRRGFFQRVVELDRIQRTVVTFYFDQDRHRKIDESAGYVLFGNRDQDHFTEPMGYSFVNSFFWVVGIQSFTMNNVEFCPEGPCLGHISIDDQFVLVRKIFYDIILKATEGTQYDDGKIMVDCEEKSALPLLRFVVGGERFKLTGDEYVIKESNNDCFTIFKFDESAKEMEFIFGTYFYEHLYLELGLYKFGKAVTRGVGLARKRYAVL